MIACKKLPVLFIDDTLITPASVYWGEFFQQHAPSANPLFTLKEISFLQSASRMLCFTGEVELADHIDQILQIPLLDKDLITQLLHNFHLDDPNSLIGCYITKLQSLYHDVYCLHAKQKDYYWQHDTLEIIMPLFVPQRLLEYTLIPV